TVRDNVISDIRSDPLSGVQTGIGVWVDTGSTATVLNNAIVRYQKGGIVALDDGTHLIAAGNTITGAGPTDVIAQNGVEVAVGAEAVVANNKISGNLYTGTDADAAGVIAFQAGRVVVTGNRLTGNGIAVIGEEQTAPLVVTANDVSGSASDGISLDGVDKAVVAGNRVSGSARDGIAVVGASSGNTIVFNSARGSGLFDGFDDTTGSGTAGTADTWAFNSLGTKSPGGLH